MDAISPRSGERSYDRWAARCSPCRLEIDLKAQSESVGRSAGRGADGREVVGRVDIVEHETRVVIKVPIEADGVALNYAAGDAGVDQIALGVAVGNFPGSFSAADAFGRANPKKRLDHLRAAERFGRPFVTAMFAGEEVAGLHIVAFQIGVAAGGLMHVGVDVLALHVQRSPNARRLPGPAG